MIITSSHGNVNMIFKFVGIFYTLKTVWNNEHYFLYLFFVSVIINKKIYMVNIPVKYKRKGITIMESRVEQAAERKKCGYNCAQAVACTYCDLAGIDEETVRNLTQGFAAGVGGSMEATCGAVIGAVNILGLINKNPQRTMQGSRKIINRFKEQNGTVICKELKGITDGVVKRECLDCVRDAAAFLEAELPDM